MRKTPMKSNLRTTIALLRRQLAGDQQGATAIEYALVASGIAVAVSAAVFTLGSATSNLFAKVLALF
jgi:pilus assembly protein Flp/PilA